LCYPGEDCDDCHIPHAAKTNAAGEQIIPLWSGEAYAGTTFVNYDSPTMDAEAGDPEGATLVCLSCHDNSHGDKYSINPDVPTGDLSGTHPMEFVYDAALAALDKELVNPTLAGSSTVVNGHGTIEKDLLSGTGKVNCQSCHEIHANGLHSYSIDEVTVMVDDDGDPTTPKVPQTRTVDFEWKIPHLVDIPGIAFKTGWGGDPEVQKDYALSYGALCRTCHIK